MRAIASIGIMAMPENFKYAGVLRKGKPQHDFYDTFRIRHPKMAAGKRAKIFSAFDALKGFSSAVSAKNELYESRRDLNEEDLQELERRLHILKGRCPARIRATFYVPCQDENSEAWGKGGQYRTLSGTCLKVDEQTGRCLLMEEERISFSDLYCLESEDGLFDEGPEAL